MMEAYGRRGQVGRVMALLHRMKNEDVGCFPDTAAYRQVRVSRCVGVTDSRWVSV